MDDQTRASNTPGEPTRPASDETYSWTRDAAEPAGGTGHDPSGGTSTGGAVLDQLRSTAEDLAEKAAPTVRELSAKAAELTAVAAVKAAPLVKRAGEITAEASEKLAESARTWAEQLRSSGDDSAAGTGAATEATADDTTHAPTPSDLAADSGVSAESTAAPAPFDTTAETGGDERPTDRPTA